MAQPRIQVRGPEPLTVAERSTLSSDAGADVAASAAVAAGAALGAESAWKAYADGDLCGYIVHDAARPGAGRAGEWVATTPAALTALYTEAAAAWTRDGTWTHQVVLPAADPLEATLLSLGFGHQQAYGEIATDAVDRSAPSGARMLSGDDLRRILPLASAVAQHQALSPVFAPRTDRFLQELDASFLEWASSDDVVVFGQFAEDTGEADGFIAIDTDTDTDTDEAPPEITLTAVSSARRGQGIGRSLLGAALTWAREQQIPIREVDWRETNPEAHAFWTSSGARITARRWSRTIDARPT